MLKWIDRNCTSLKPVDMDREVRIMTGTEFIASLDEDGYDSEKFTELESMVDAVFADALDSEWTDSDKNAVCFDLP